MTAQQKADWQRWAIGIIVTVILALVVHIGDAGAVIKQRMTAHEVKQSATDAKVEDIKESTRRIEAKLDRLIERK